MHGSAPSHDGFVVIVELLGLAGGDEAGFSWAGNATPAGSLAASGSSKSPAGNGFTGEEGSREGFVAFWQSQE